MGGVCLSPIQFPKQAPEPSDTVPHTQYQQFTLDRWCVSAFKRQNCYNSKKGGVVMLAPVLSLWARGVAGRL